MKKLEFEDQNLLSNTTPSEFGKSALSLLQKLAIINNQNKNEDSSLLKLSTSMESGNDIILEEPVYNIALRQQHYDLSNLSQKQSLEIIFQINTVTTQFAQSAKQPIVAADLSKNFQLLYQNGSFRSNIGQILIYYNTNKNNYLINALISFYLNVLIYSQFDFYCLSQLILMKRYFLQTQKSHKQQLQSIQQFKTNFSLLTVDAYELFMDFGQPAYIYQDILQQITSQLNIQHYQTFRPQTNEEIRIFSIYLFILLYQQFTNLKERLLKFKKIKLYDEKFEICDEYDSTVIVKNQAFNTLQYKQLIMFVQKFKQRYNDILGYVYSSKLHFALIINE